MFKFRIKKYLKRTDFMNSVDTNKIWSKKVTIPETLDIIEQLENELAKLLFTKSFPLDLGDIAADLKIFDLNETNYIIFKKNGNA